MGPTTVENIEGKKRKYVEATLCHKV